MMVLMLGACITLLLAIVVVPDRRAAPDAHDDIDDLILMDVAADGELDGRFDPD